MHICTVVPSYLPHFGGAEVGVHEILDHLAQTTEHRFSVITSQVGNQGPTYEKINHVEVYRYRRPDLWARWFAPTLIGFYHNPRLIAKLKPDVLHISYLLPSGISAWYVARRRGLPTVILLGGNDVYDPFHQPPGILRMWMTHCIRQSPSIAAFSSWTKNYLVEQHGAAPDSIHVTHFGIDLTRFHPGIDGQSIRERYGISKNALLIFALQRLEQRKGVDILLKALAYLNKESVHLLIGGKGRDSGSMQQLATQLGIEKQVTFCGFVDEREKHLHYAAADIFALHSYHEGLGIVLAEAAACGIPLVTTNAGGTTDIALNNKTGLTVAPGDSEAMALALRELVDNPERRRVMGRAAAEHARQFEMGRVAEGYLRLFETAPRL